MAKKPQASARPERAKVFWTGRSQAVRLPKAFRFASETVVVSRHGKGILLEPDDAWPEGWFESFTGITEDFVAPPRSRKQRKVVLR